MPTYYHNMTLLLTLLITGFLVYWLIRHPIKSIKFIGAFVGLILLGTLTFVVIYYALIWPWVN